MRIFTKELVIQSTDRLVNPSVQIMVKRYMPKNRRYTVSTWTGWPMDHRQYHGASMSKGEALALAVSLLNKSN
jgi:hypothetical protein